MNLRRLLYTGGLALLTSISTPLYGQSSHIADGGSHPLSSRSLVEVDKHSINTANLHREMFNGTQQELEAHLADLMSTADREEAWVYLPALQRSYEIGHAEHESGAKLDLDFVQQIIEKNDSVVFYHIHPLQTISNYNNISPSNHDVDITREIATVHHNLRPDAYTEHRIIVPRGIISLEPKPREALQYDLLIKAYKSLWPQGVASDACKDIHQTRALLEDANMCYRFMPFEN